VPLLACPAVFLSDKLAACPTNILRIGHYTGCQVLSPGGAAACSQGREVLAAFALRFVSPEEGDGRTPGWIWLDVAPLGFFITGCTQSRG
jgi:hypothetical protein